MHKRAAVIFLAFCFIWILAGISEAQLIKGKKPELIKGKQPEKQVKKSISFPEGSTIQYSFSGKLHKVSIYKPCEVQGIMWPENTHLEFDETGKLQWAYIHNPTTIDGVTWPSYSNISFLQTGKINCVYLGKDCIIQGKEFKVFNVLKIDSKGQVIKVRRR